MKKSTIQFASLILFFVAGLQAEASCYVQPLPDLDCVQAGSDITNLGWTPNYAQRVILYTTPDVQDSSVGCTRFGHLMQAECKLNEPIQLTYYPNPLDLNQREVTFVTGGDEKLNQAEGLSQKFKEYFSGTLRPTQALDTTTTTRPKVIDAHSRDEVLNFLRKPVGQAMRFRSSCSPPGAIINDGQFMAACTRDSAGVGRLELMRIATGCTDCIDKVEDLLGKFSYDGSSLTETNPTLAATSSKISYTDTEMPLLNQFSGYLPIALGIADRETAGYCSPVAATMAMISLKARSSPYTVLGNVLDLPGCAHTLNGSFYGDCSLKIARVAEYMDWKKAITTTVNGMTSVNTYGNLAGVTNAGARVDSSATVNIRMSYYGLLYTADTRCANRSTCENLPWFRVPAQNTTATDLSTLGASALQTITSTGYKFSGPSAGSMSQPIAATMAVRKSVASPFPLDARKTWVLMISPLFFYQNASHAVTVSGINSAYVTVNDPHGLRYNLKSTSCNVLVADSRTFDGGAITADYLTSKTKLTGDVYRFVKTRYGITKVNLDNPLGGGVQQLGTCLSMYSGVSDLFKNSPFWVLTGHWSALPWGAGAKWDQASRDNTGRIWINPTTQDTSTALRSPTPQSLIAEQTGVTRAAAFRDPDTVARCRSNIFEFTTKVAGVQLQVRPLQPIFIKDEGITQALCEKFEIRDVTRNNSAVNPRYGRVSLACVNDQIELRNLDCSTNTYLYQPVANGRAIRFYDEVSKSFSRDYTIESCQDNWILSKELNSCICEQPNANNQVVWTGEKSACVVICNKGMSPGLWTDGKYRCSPDSTLKYTSLEDHTCRFTNPTGQIVTGTLRDGACYPPKNGDVCAYSPTINGTMRSDVCMPPAGITCTKTISQQNFTGLTNTAGDCIITAGLTCSMTIMGQTFQGRTTITGCSIANNLPCTYIRPEGNVAGHTYNNLCLPNIGTACTFTRNNAAVSGQISSNGFCLANDGVNCEFNYYNTIMLATYSNGVCKPADGTTCTYYGYGYAQAIPGGKFLNGICKPPDGSPCSVGEGVNRLTGTFTNGLCSVAYGSPCNYVTELGQTVVGTVSGPVCRPPAGTPCAYRDQRNILYVGGTINGTQCRVPDETDCSYTLNGVTTFAKFSFGSCQNVVEGGTCAAKVGPRTLNGTYVRGVCTPPAGASCQRTNSLGQIIGNGQYYDGQCGLRDAEFCSLRIGNQTFQGRGTRGVCVVPDDTVCFVSITTGTTFTVTRNYEGKIKNNQCQINDGATCTAENPSFSALTAVYKNGVCQVTDGQICSIIVEGNTYAGKTLNGVCKPNDGLPCTSKAFSNNPIAFFKNSVCTPTDGQSCTSDTLPRWAFATYLNGLCVAPDNTPCRLDPTDENVSGTMRLGLCARPLSLPAPSVPAVPLASLRDGDECIAYNLLTTPTGYIKSGLCLPKDGTRCAISYYGSNIPAAYSSGTCIAQENYPCDYPYGGVLYRGSFINNKCTPTEGSYCPYRDAARNIVVQGEFKSGQCSALCNANSHAEDGACVLNTRACTNANFVLNTQTWDGSDYGACGTTCDTLTSHLENGICKPNIKECMNGFSLSTQVWNGTTYSACQAITCDKNSHVEGLKCVSNTRLCKTASGYEGIQYWNGTQYDICRATSCPSNYHLESIGVCKPNTRSCTIAHGVGQQTWNNLMSEYGACTAASCSTGYIIDSQTKLCSLPHYHATTATTPACSVSVQIGISPGCPAEGASCSNVNQVTCCLQGISLAKRMICN